MRKRSLTAAGLGCLLLVLAGGCVMQDLQEQNLYEDQQGFRLAEQADIDDSTKNRQVLNVVAEYQRAITNKDFGTLKRLVAEEYYDNAGTTDTTEDDYGASRLPNIYEQMAQHAKQIKYDITVEKIEYERNRAFVDYEYEYAYKVDVGEKPTWDAGVDVNQLELISKDGDWKIISGL